MAWTSVKETFGRKFSTGVNDTNGVRVFFCKSDTAITDISLATVASAGGVTIPLKGASWPAGGANTTGLKVSRIIPEEVEREKKTYQVTVEYSTESEKDQFTPNPVDRDWRVHWSPEWVEEVPYRTAVDTRAAGIVSSFPTGAEFEIKGRDDGKPIVNAVKDRVAAVDRRAVMTCALQKYYTSAVFTTTLGGVSGLAAYLDTCNDTAITVAGLTAGIYTLLMDSVDIENVTENGYDVLSVTYKIIYDPYTHSNILLNAGFNAYLTASTPPAEKIARSGQASSDAAPLNDDGTLCADTQKRIYYAYGVKKVTTWSTLGLPAAIPT